MDDLTGGARREERTTGMPDATIRDPEDTIGGVAGGGGSGTGERATGTPNTIYDLSSVLFHALEGGASYDTYIQDAEREGDKELADFFRRVRDEDSARADEAQILLAERTPAAGRTGGMTTGDAMAEPEPSGAPPMPEEGPLRREERASLGREDPLPREERASLGREDPLPREERASLGREDPLPREERASLGREDPQPREEESRETGREEDKGLLDRAKEALTGEEREGREEPPTRRP
jgi:hypothetical protein